MNQKNFICGDIQTLMDQIRRSDLKISSFEEMFNIIVMNRENIRIGDYQQMLYFKNASFFFCKT